MLARGNTEGANCKDCPFARGGCAPKPVAAIGPEKPKMIVIGEGPGWSEVQQGTPFIGPSGQLVTKMLNDVGVKRSDVWITNATLCFPKGAKVEQRYAAAQACLGRLKGELAQFPGVPVLTLGAVSIQALKSDPKISIAKIMGTLHEVDGHKVIATIHPAAILRGGMTGAQSPDLLYWRLKHDAGKVHALARGKDISPSEKIEYIYKGDWKSADNAIARVCRIARNLKAVAIDFETDGRDGHSALEANRAEINAIGLGTNQLAVSIHRPLVSPNGWQMFKDLLKDPSVTKIAHNRLYEDTVSRWHGISIQGRFDCTLLMHHSLFPGIAHDLQAAVSMFFAVQPWKSEYRDSGDSLEDHVKYNAQDTFWTFWLWEAMKDRTYGKATYEHDLKQAELAAEMHMRGVPISREENQKLLAEMYPRVEAEYKKVAKFWDVPELRETFINFVSSEQARKRRKTDPPDYLSRRALRRDELLAGIAKAESLPEDQLIQQAKERAKKKRKNDHDDYDERVKQRFKEFGFHFNLNATLHVAGYLKATGVPLTARTEKGKISTDKETLEGLGKHDSVRAILDYRSVEHLLKGFVRPIPYYLTEDDRMHVMWSVYKITGRWGCEFSSIMNWPKANIKKNVPSMRRQVVAPPGRLLVDADKEQLEARIIALLSGDPWLLSLFNSDSDIHAACAEVVFGDLFTREVPKSPKWRELRDLIKRVEYGALYGGSDRTLYESLVKEGYTMFSFELISEAIAKLKAKMSLVPAWQNECVRQAAKHGVIRSGLLGRERYFLLELDDTARNTAINFGVQSTGADIVGLNLLELREKLPKADPTAFIFAQLHDAVLVECAEERADEVQSCVTECMTSFHELNGNRLIFPGKAKIGKSWSDFD